jgi:hypothetical protein
MLAAIADQLSPEEGTPLMTEAVALASTLADALSRQRLLTELKSRTLTTVEPEGKGAQIEQKSLALTLKRVEYELEKCARIPRNRSLSKLVALAPDHAFIGGDDLLLAMASEIRETASWWRSDGDEKLGVH